MNALDGSLKDDADKNPDGLDELLEGTRIDLLENKVVLAVPEGNPKNIDSFDKLADRLGAGEGFLAIGNSDVPVGQYTRKIFAHYGLDEQSLADAGVAHLRLERQGSHHAGQRGRSRLRHHLRDRCLFRRS